MRALLATPRLLTRLAIGIIFALIILSFALWGTGDLLRGRVTAGSVARVGPLEIAQGEFLRAYNTREVPQGRQRGQAQADEAIRILVDSQLLSLESEKLELAIGEKDLTLSIAEFPGFEGPDGSFDPARFRFFLESTGFSEAEFADRFRLDIQAQRLQSALFAGAQANPVTAELLAEYELGQRTARYIRVKSEDQPDPELPGEEALAAYYEEVKERYRTQELRRATWLWLDPALLSEQVEVSEEKLRELYEELRDERYLVEEERSFRQVVVASEEEALTLIAEKAVEAEALAEAGEEAALDGALSRGLTEAAGADGANNADGAGDADGADEAAVTTALLEGELLGPLPPSSMQEDVAAALFAVGQETGLVPDPVESPFGWHVLEVAEIIPGSETPFEEVREALEEEYVRLAADERGVEEANRLDELLGSGLSLEDAAAEAGFIAGGAVFNRFGQDEEGTALEGLPADRGFLQAVFTEERTGESGLLREAQQAGGYYAFRLDAITPPADRPFADVREEVLERWTAEQKSDAARALAEELARRFREGEALEALAEEHGLEAEESESLARSTGWPFVYLANELFDLEGEEDAAVAALEQDFAAVTLAEAAPPDSGSEEARRAFWQQAAALRNQRINELFAGYMAALREDYGVEIYEESIAVALDPYAHGLR